MAAFWKSGHSREDAALGDQRERFSMYMHFFKQTRRRYPENLRPGLVPGFSFLSDLRLMSASLPKADIQLDLL